MAEFHTVRVSAMFATDAQLDFRASTLAFFDRNLHELADASLVDRSKGVPLDDFQLLIRSEEGAGIVAAHRQGGLSQVVGAETEELSGLRDLIRREGAAGHFDHRSDQII